MYDYHSIVWGARTSAWSSSTSGMGRNCTGLRLKRTWGGKEKGQVSETAVLGIR